MPSGKEITDDLSDARDDDDTSARRSHSRALAASDAHGQAGGGAWDGAREPKQMKGFWPASRPHRLHRRAQARQCVHSSRPLPFPPAALRQNRAFLCTRRPQEKRSVPTGGLPPASLACAETTPRGRSLGLDSCPQCLQIGSPSSGQQYSPARLPPPPSPAYLSLLSPASLLLLPASSICEPARST